jgi:hypothetical protein
MQGPPPLQQYGVVGQFLRQDVLEGVRRLRERRLLVEELLGLQVGE